MKKFILSEENLKKIDACQGGIDFVKRNNLLGLDFFKLNIEGDYNNFVNWLRHALTHEYRYDRNNNLIWEKDERGNIREYKYDKNNNIIWKKDWNGNIYEYKYDKNNNLIWMKDWNGDIREWEYNENNNLIFQKDWRGNIGKWEYKYDENKRLIEIIENNKTILKINTNEAK